MQKHKKKYLALGDSYTVGEAVAKEESFPYQLQRALYAKGCYFQEPQIIATTGWTTENLMAGIKQADLRGKYDLFTLLIGVNNQYQGLSPENFRMEFRELLEYALSMSVKGSETCLVISIPDCGVTPFAEGRDRARIAEEIDLFNKICREESRKLQVEFIDITGISRLAADQADLNASDGLHPSGKMYGMWAELIAEGVCSKINSET